MLKHGPLHTIGGTSQWDDPQRVREHFRRFGVERIVTHFKLTSEEFSRLFRHGFEVADYSLFAYNDDQFSNIGFGKAKSSKY